MTATAERAAGPDGPGRPAAIAPGAAAGRPAASRRRRALLSVLSLAVIAGVFGFALPRIASYGGVWSSLTAMSWPELLLIGAAFAVSQLCTWLMIAAVLPGLRLRRAAMANMSSTAVANTLPGGGAIAMGVSWAMMSSWGIGTGQYVRYTLVSGVWNVLARLGLPVVALALLVLAGRPGTALQAAAFAGAAALIVLAAGFRAVLRSERAAGLAGRAVSRVLAAGCALIRRRPPQDVTGMLTDFRAGASRLVTERGLRITVTTAASQVTLWLVLLCCLRCCGLTQAQVPWAESLAAFAFVRLLSVLPLTPGGVGVVELGLTGALAASLGPGAAARVAAAVLLYRAVTYLLPVPLGAACYLCWRRTRRGSALPAGSALAAGRALPAG
ncbi:MAG: flippase-like domain-containing protein [Streptosporangiaceae bacterium]